MMTRRSYVWLSLVFAAILFVGVNIVVDNFFTDARLDLTQNGQYTLSAGTRATIAKLPEPVTLRFFFSKKNSAAFPVTAAYAKRVRDLLAEYASISNGKIQVEDVDPESFTPEQDQAEAAGIRSAPQANGDSFYFGLEGINSIDGSESIPYLALEREPYLEYDLTSLLYRLSHPDKPKLAILGTLPLTSNPTNQQPFAIYSELRRNYDTTTLQPSFTAVPAGTDLLMVVQPENVSLEQQRAIATYLFKGGKALIFVDPLSEIIREAGQNSGSSLATASDMPDLLKGLGVDYSPDTVVLDRALAQHIRAGDQNETVVYPLWMHLRDGNFAPRDPVTASLTSMNLASAGSLSQTKGATTHFEPLLMSSNQASLSATESVTSAMNDPASLLDQTSADGKSFTLAARITGHAKVNGLGEGDVNLIVVADTDVFDDRFWVRPSDDQTQSQPFSDNGAFVLGAVENLSGSGDLISLRTRGTTERPFLVVAQMQNDAELKFRETLTALQGKLAASENEMSQLQAGKGAGAGNNTALTPAQNAEIEKLRRDIAGTRLQLRDVQRNLRTDIDRLGTILAFLNILLIPALVAAFAIVHGLIRRRRAQAAPRIRTAKAGTA